MGSTSRAKMNSFFVLFLVIQLSLFINIVTSFVITPSSGPSSTQRRSHQVTRMMDTNCYRSSFNRKFDGNHRLQSYYPSYIFASSSFSALTNSIYPRPLSMYRENHEMEIGMNISDSGGIKKSKGSINGEDKIIYGDNSNGGNGNGNGNGDGDGNNGNGDGNENHNNGNSNGDDNSDNISNISAALTISSLLKKYGQSIDSLPPPLQKIAKSLQDSTSKKITSLEEIQLNVMKSYFNLLYINPKAVNSLDLQTKVPLSLMGKLLWKPIFAVEGLRDRILMDPGFTTKLGIEVTIGLTMQGLAEYERRRESIWKEFDFVIANCLTGLIANFSALYLSAPTLANAMVSTKPSLSAASSGGILRKLVEVKKALPDNAFQTVAPGQTPFTLSQRFLTMVFAAPNLFAVGAAATACGYGLTSALASFRKNSENIETAKDNEGGNNSNRSEVSILKTSVVIGTYLAISSNLRYQMVAGVIEQRMLDPFCNRLPMLTNQMINPATAEMLKASGSFAARTANTFLGAAFLIDFLKVFGCNG